MTLCCAPACKLTPERIERLDQAIRAIRDDDPDLHDLMQALGYDDSEYAKQAVLAKCQAIERESRDICMLCIPDCPYLLLASGGMSWGDTPTESYSVLEHVERCPQAWQEMERFAREDFMAAKQEALCPSSKS